MFIEPPSVSPWLAEPAPAYEANADARAVLTVAAVARAHRWADGSAAALKPGQRRASKPLAFHIGVQAPHGPELTFTVATSGTSR